MSCVLIIGAGGVGNVVVKKCAQLPEIFSKIWLASRSLSKCEKIAAEVKRPIETAQIDADHVSDVAALIRKGQDLGKACAISDGSMPRVRLVAGEDVAVCLPAGTRDEITLEVDAPPVVTSPIQAGAPLGLLRVLIGDSLAVSIPAVAAREVRRATMFDRLGLSLGFVD